MPPAPKPVQASAVARAGTERRPPSSAAIGLSATMTIHGAPKDTARITSTTAATTQDDRVSTDGTAIRSCIEGSRLCCARGARLIGGGAAGGLDVLKRLGPPVRCEAAECGRSRATSWAFVPSCSEFRRIYRVPDHAARPPAWGAALCKTLSGARHGRAGCAKRVGANRRDACGQPPHKLLTIL